MRPIATAPRDGTWIRLYASGYRITSHPVRWCATGRKGAGWYSARGECFGSPIFDRWLPVTGAAPTGCKVLGVKLTATREQIVAAYRERAKVTHPDVGGSTEAMHHLNRARDEALAAVGG
jgi:hypothetical protein